MGGPLIMMYNLDNLTGSKIRLMCLKQKLHVINVSTQEYSKPIGALAGLIPHIAPETIVMDAAQNGFSDEMLLLCNLDGAMLNTFLQGFRANKIPGVALKAILTPTNINWNSIQLHDELVKEHEAMQEERSKH